MKTWYNVNGLSLIIEADPPELISAIDQHVGPFAAEASDRHDYSIAIVRGLVEAPPDGVEVIVQNDILPGVAAQCATQGERSWLIVPERLSIMSDHTARATAICIGADCDRPLQALAVMQAIDTALAASGRHLLHGAALAMPGEALRALLIFAPSGVGKTTTALALALGGFGLATDDAIVLQPHDHQAGAPAGVWGLPRALKVHRRTAELLPAIAPLLGPDWDEQGEQLLTLAALDGVARTIVPRPIPVAAIAILEEWSAAADHAFAPIDKSRGLLHLAQDNVRRTPGGVPAAQAKRFAALATLLVATPMFRLRVGANIAQLPGYVSSELLQHLRPDGGFAGATDLRMPS